MPLLGPEPVDEIVWSDPILLRTLPEGNLNSQSVHYYFYNSPFFDRSSNNEIIFTESQHFANKEHLQFDRHAFENAVRAMPSGGLQFLITDEPKTEDGAWIMEKQMRTVRRGMEDEIEILGTYWIAMNRVFAAPNIADLLQAKFVAISNLLGEFFEAGSSLSHFTPATGHTYLPPSYKAPKAAALGSGSRATTPGLGTENNSQIPSSQLTTNTSVPSQPTAASIATTGAATTATEPGGFPDNFFLESLFLTKAYGDEYMDENPLQGEPGSFVFSSTNEMLAAKNASQEAAARRNAALSQATTTVAGSQQTVSVRGGATPGAAGGHSRSFDGEGTGTVSTAANTPRPVHLEGNGGSSSRKGSVAKVGKSKEARRKSKVTISPVTPTAPSAPGGAA